jgi:Fe-S-cluster-containing hydrogenase component 2
VEAITVGDSIAEVEEIRCFGCGLCVSTCPAEAITLEGRKGYEEPVDTGMDLFEAFLEGVK